MSDVSIANDVTDRSNRYGLAPKRPVLYSFRRCPYAMRARLAIAASGVACELREVVLRNKPAEMLQASPKGTVPVLIDVDGAVVEQSLDIMRWALTQHDPEQWCVPEQGTTEDMMALIAANDGDFKRHLDRYKYPNRYDGVNALEERDAGAAWLREFDARLRATPWLSGARTSLADMAIAPFVRQFAHTDKAWFAAQDWPALTAWLARIVDSERYAHVMQKFAPWDSGTEGLAFP